jgi:hypothetical protein
MVGDHLKAQGEIGMDITKLEGYSDTLTSDEKLALIQKYEPPTPDDAEAKKWKAQFDKAASELAAANKALKAKMTEDEQKEAERIASETAMKNELEALRKETAISRHKADYIGLGYDEKLAEDTAKALAEGDMAKVFANQKAHQEALAKAAKAAALAGGDPPPAGNGGKPVDKKAFDAMSSADQIKFMSENPNWKEIIMKKE